MDLTVLAASGTHTTFTYSNLSSIRVAQGQAVLAGTTIGTAGTAAKTGLKLSAASSTSTQPSKAIDPIGFLTSTDAIIDPSTPTTSTTTSATPAVGTDTANISDTVDSANCPVHTPVPALISKDDEQGDFLISPDAAGQITSSGGDPQNPCVEAMFVTDQLAQAAADVSADHPDRFNNADEYSKYWQDAIARSGLILDPAAAADDTCLQTPDSSDVGEEISIIFSCEARTRPSLVTVTSVDGSHIMTVEGTDSRDVIISEAQSVAWAFSQWGKKRCRAGDVVSGVFPLTKAQASKGGAKDRCNVEQNIRAAARLIFDVEKLPLIQRPHSTPFEKMIGGWNTIPYALGKDKSSFMITGPADNWTPSADCQQLITQWQVQVESDTSPLGEYAAKIPAHTPNATSPSNAGTGPGSPSTASSGTNTTTDTTTSAPDSSTPAELDSAVHSTLDKYPAPAAQCHVEASVIYDWLVQVDAESGEQASSSMAHISLIAWISSQESSLRPAVQPGIDSLVSRLSSTRRSLPSPPLTSQLAPASQSLQSLSSQVVTLALSMAGHPENGEWVMQSTCGTTGDQIVATSGPATSAQDLSSEQVAAMIYAQAMGLGLGKNAALIGIFVGEAESHLNNLTKGDSWRGGPHKGHMTPSRGVFQQMGSWVPAPYKAWSGQPWTMDTSENYTKDNAWGPNGWAEHDPRMNVQLAANLFFTGPAYDSKAGLEDDPKFQANASNPNLDQSTALAIAHDVQGFSTSDLSYYASNFNEARKVMDRIVTGQIPVPSYLNDPVTSRRTTSITLAGSATSGASISMVQASDPCPASGAASVGFSAPGSTKLPYNSRVPAQWGFDIGGVHPMTYYSQYDPRWSEESTIFSRPFKDCACGPTSLSMVIATLAADSSVTPTVIAQRQKALGGQEPGHCGTGDKGVLVKIAQEHGLHAQALGSDFTTGTDIIKRGGMLIASVTAGHFTKGGHWIVIRGVTADGHWLVANALMGYYNPTTLTEVYAPSSSDFPLNQGLIGIWR